MFECLFRHRKTPLPPWRLVLGWCHISQLWSGLASTTILYFYKKAVKRLLLWVLPPQFFLNIRSYMVCLKVWKGVQIWGRDSKFRSARYGTSCASASAVEWFSIVLSRQGESTSISYVNINTNTVWYDVRYQVIININILNVNFAFLKR